MVLFKSEFNKKKKNFFAITRTTGSDFVAGQTFSTKRNLFQEAQYHHQADVGDAVIAGVQLKLFLELFHNGKRQLKLKQYRNNDVEDCFRTAGLSHVSFHNEETEPFFGED